MSKKGISPLIGTVLLVAVVIAMILLIMPWITKTIKTQQERSTEALTAMDCIDKLGFELLIGTGNAITVENTDQADIYQLTFRTYDTAEKLITSTKDPTTINLAVPKVAAYGTYTSGVICDSATVYKVEVIATIKSGNKQIVCGDTPREVVC